MFGFIYLCNYCKVIVGDAQNVIDFILKACIRNLVATITLSLSLSAQAKVGNTGNC